MMSEGSPKMNIAKKENPMSFTVSKYRDRPIPMSASDGLLKLKMGAERGYFLPALPLYPAYQNNDSHGGKYQSLRSEFLMISMVSIDLLEEARTQVLERPFSQSKKGTKSGYLSPAPPLRPASGNNHLCWTAMHRYLLPTPPLRPTSGCYHQGHTYIISPSIITWAIPVHHLQSQSAVQPRRSHPDLRCRR